MKNQYKQITNLKTYLVSIVIFAAGCIFLILSEFLTFSTGYLWIRSILANLGSLIIASVSIAFIWDLFSKREFLNELLANTGLAEEIRYAGLQGLGLVPLRGPDFSKIIRSAHRLDIFVCYANTWRATFEEDLKYLAQKQNCRIRLIVPNPENLDSMADLAKRFGAADAETMQSRIKQAIVEYKAIFNSINNTSLDFSVWTHTETPVTSFYRFDLCAVFTLYKHSKGRGNVPTFVAERGGTLYDYIENEVDAMIKGCSPNDALATMIFSNKAIEADSNSSR